MRLEIGQAKCLNRTSRIVSWRTATSVCRASKGEPRLRDAFAVMAVQHDDSTDGIRMLQVWLGHASIATTMRYRKVAGRELKERYQGLWVKKETDSVEALRPSRNGFLRAFGCGWFMKKDMVNKNGTQGNL